jgi:preprotein translocase subunit SecG
VRAVNSVAIVVHSLLSVLVIFLVLVHSGRDSGLSGAFGVGAGAGSSGGGTAIVERNLDRLTVVAGILFFVTTIFLAKRL